MPICEICQTDFAGRASAKTCGPKCKQMAYRQRKGNAKSNVKVTNRNTENVTDSVTDNPVPSSTNEYYDLFAAAYRAHYGRNYDKKDGDFVQLAKLRKAGAVSLEDWQRALSHYFQTSQGSHTLADLSSRFATFALYPLDRFGKPLRGKVVPLKQVVSDEDPLKITVTPEMKEIWQFLADLQGVKLDDWLDGFIAQGLLSQSQKQQALRL